VVYELILRNEDRDVWKLFLENGQFETALSYCKEPNAREKKDKVWTSQAEHFFSQSKYELAAAYFGKTLRVFEEVTLKFININERDALKTYLLHKLENIRPKEATQRTIICTWLTEIYVNKLNALKDRQKEQYSVIQVYYFTYSSSSFVNHTILQEEFQHFLADNKDHLNQATTFHIISSHGCIDELLFYAGLIDDHERVISHHIQHADYKKALAVLDRLGEAHEEMFYKFSPVLMHYAPIQTVNVWIKASFLNPVKLIPALMR
jgi:vacuolar protein sorting-associated protein 18